MMNGINAKGIQTALSVPSARTSARILRHSPKAPLPVAPKFAGRQEIRVRCTLSQPKKAGKQASGKKPRTRCGVAMADEVATEEKTGEQITVVMKFGGSSVATAERMREIAKIILSFKEERPALILSAMGKTTNNLLLAGEQAVQSVTNSEMLDGLTRSLIEHEAGVHKNEDDITRDVGCEYLCTFERIELLHHQTCDDLGISRDVVQTQLNDLQRLLLGIALMKEVSPRTKDLLVSFGERMSTRIFAAYLNETLKVPAKQYDAWDIGFLSTDEFTNARVDYDKTLAHVKEKLTFKDGEMHIPVITGFLAKGESTGAITTLGRGGSDLSATIVGAALGLREVQVWKDVDGIMSTDPRRAPNAVTVPFLTFEEATELAFFGATVLHPQAMAPARKIDMPVRVKNSYNPPAAGTLITGQRDMSNVLLTSIVLKSNVTLVDVMSERKTGFIGFASNVFVTLRELSISTDVVATSETSITASLDPAQLWSRELSSEELKEMVEALEEKCESRVTLYTNKAIVSLIGNVNRSAEILMSVFKVLHDEGIQVNMISQGASKVNISLVVDNEEADRCVKVLHRSFFE